MQGPIQDWLADTIINACNCIRHNLWQNVTVYVHLVGFIFTCIVIIFLQIQEKND